MNHLTDAVLQAWIDEELDPGDRVQVADHLASCSDCRDSLTGLRAAATLFSEALVLHDEGLKRTSTDERSAGRMGRIRMPQKWIGRAAAVMLLVGGAAAAAVVPGSPLRDWIRGSDTVVANSPSESAVIETGRSPGASITVPLLDGRLRIRIKEFPARTQIRILLTDGALAVASLPDDEQNARFVVAAGLLEVVGPGSNGASQEGIGLVLQLPRRIQSGVIELDGVIGARISSDRIVAERQVSRLGDQEVIIVVGG